MAREKLTHDELGVPLRAGSPVSVVSHTDAMAEAMKAVAQALESTQKSSIRIAPSITWPGLRDDDDNRQIGTFLKALEDIFTIDNGGRGMGHAERPVCLRMFLHGTRKMVYENVVKSVNKDDVNENNPQAVYKRIKDELMRFSETAMEKTVRVRNEWKKNL